MPRRRILFYIHGLSGGGAERVWTVLAAAMSAAGHDVTVAVDRLDGEAPPDLNGVKIEVLGDAHGTATLRLARLLRRLAPDVALSAVSSSNLKLAIAARLAGKRRTGIIVSYHGATEHLSGRLGWLGVTAIPLISRLADRTVGVSDGMRAHLVEKWGADGRRTVRVYNPVAVGGDPHPIAIPDLMARPPLILSVGRLVPDKAVDITLRAMARLEHREARLVVLGDGPDLARLQALAAELGLADRVTFAGFVAEPWAYYAGARCIAHASRFEAFGNVLVEAMAHGLAVVATDCDGPREILDRGAFGTLVPIDDVTAMAAAIDRALSAPGDPGPRQSRSAAFSVAAGVAAYEALIEAVIAERAT